jgi:hypothetical protein
VGERNENLFKAACSYRRRLQDDHRLVELVTRELATRCVPPPSDAEVTKILDSAFKQAHDDVQRYASEWDVVLQAHEGWDDPLPLVTNSGLPVFPVESLPPVMAEMVQAVAANVQVPVDVPAVLALAVVNAALVGRVRLRVRDGWTEAMALYTLCIIESGNRKSAAIRPLVKPLRDVESDLRAAMAQRVREAETQLHVLKAVEAGAASRVKRNPDDYAAREALRAARWDVTVAEASMPSLPVLVLDDPTPEALTHEMARQGERMAMFDAEGGGLITAAGARYGDTPNLDLLLKSHAGDPVSQVRIGRGAVSMQHPTLTIGVLSQPESLAELRKVHGAEGRGLLARLLVSAPADLLGRREIETPPVPESVALAYGGLVVSLVRSLWDASLPVFLDVDRPGYKRLLDFAHEVEAQLDSDGDLRPLGGFAGKLVGAAARYAALHHIGWYGVAGLQQPVGEYSVYHGIEIARYSIEHYRYAVRASGWVTETATADRILGWIKRKSVQRFSGRDVQRTLALTAADEVDAALRLLENCGFIRAIVTAREKRVGRTPSQQYQVNPRFGG